MKKVIISFMIMTGICVFSSDNLLKNPSFENDKAKKYKESDRFHRAEKLHGWNVADWSGKPKGGYERGKVGLKASSDAVHGKSSGYLYTSGQGRNKLLIYQMLKFSPGSEQKYILCFKFKKADPENKKTVKVFASCIVYKKDKDTAKKVKIAYKHSQALDASDEWQSISFPFATSAEAETLQLMLRTNNDGGILFDEVVLKKEKGNKND